MIYQTCPRFVQTSLLDPRLLRQQGAAAVSYRGASGQLCRLGPAGTFEWRTDPHGPGVR